MNTIYQRIIDEKNRTTNAFELDVLGQLLLIVFKNKERPDELPEKFTIKNVLLSQDIVEDIFERLHINAVVSLKLRYYGCTYDVITI